MALAVLRSFLPFTVLPPTGTNSPFLITPSLMRRARAFFIALSPRRLLADPTLLLADVTSGLASLLYTENLRLTETTLSVMGKAEVYLSLSANNLLHLLSETDGPLLAESRSHRNCVWAATASGHGTTTTHTHGAAAVGTARTETRATDRTRMLSITILHSFYVNQFFSKHQLRRDSPVCNRFSCHRRQ